MLPNEMTGWCGTTMTWREDGEDSEENWKQGVYPSSWSQYESWPEEMAGPEYWLYKKELDDEG